MQNRRAFSILWLLTLYQVQSNLADGSDSLRSALEAVTRRQRDLSDHPAMYYLEPEGRYRHLGGEIAVYLPQRDNEGDGQPEDIGYGYQKSVSPKTAGIFEPIALPKTELGIHDFSEGNHLQGNSRGLEKLILEYLEENNEQPEDEDTENFFRPRHPDSKRSIFRERGDGHLPDALQRLYLEESENIPSYEDEDQPRNIPSPFRERFKGKSKNLGLHNAQALVRNFGGLDRDTENQHDGDDDSDEYMNVLNSVWEKYKDSNLDTFDPEDISESDVAELMEYMDTKGEKKRQYGNSYQTGYDFFNSPLQWAKRSKQKSGNIYRPESEGYFHALKVLSGNRDALESVRGESVPNDDQDRDVTRLLMDRPSSHRNEKSIHRKRLWQGGAFDERYPYKSVAKRYPIAKRSPSYYASPTMLYHKSSSTNISQRKKKNANDVNSLDTTDPKVAQELSDIFSASNVHTNNSPNNYKSKAENFNNVNNNLNMSNDLSNETQNKTVNIFNNNNNDTKNVRNQMANTHKHVKRTGQKEETISNSLHKPLEISKKSVDWSDYFGIDRRRKKSTNKDFNDEWLLNQYLKAYSLSSNALKDSNDAFNDAYSSIDENNYDMKKKGQDDMDAKLRAMEDLIVDQALKYTGAHEGMTDSKEVQEVKDRVISQLAAAYSLEKMRRALGEFKSSIAAQKATAPTSQPTTPPNVTPGQPEKRIAVKKEKAEREPNDGKMEKKEEMENDIKLSHLLDASENFPHWSAEQFVPDQNPQNCPILKDVSLRCKEVANIAGDVNGVFLPLCSLHQICYLCGSEIGGSTPTKCDTTFLSEALSVCQDNASCRYTAHQTIAALHALKADISPTGCDWQNHPCLAYFLSVAVQ